MLIAFVSVSLLISVSYGLSKLINGAVGTFVFSAVACGFFTWRFFSFDVTAEVTDSLQRLLRALSVVHLPLAILTLIVAISSVIYLFAIKVKNT